MKEKLLTAEQEALRLFRESLAQGGPWFPSLLEAIGRWASPEEEVAGRRYRYLIGGEAFDWLRLAERLCAEVDGLVPEAEVEALLFHGKAPVEISPEEFKAFIGADKYRAQLNYFYGVVVEEALLGAVEGEVRKEQRSLGLCHEERVSDEACGRIYGATYTALLERFRRERGYPLLPAMGLEEQKEFTYYLFKYRLRHCEPARVASDTKKGLQYLRRQGQGKPPR